MPIRMSFCLPAPRILAHRLVAFMLLLLGQTAVAAETDDRLLTRVDAYRNDGRIDLVVGLTHGYRYVSHSLDASGNVLQVRLRLEQTANGDAGTVDGVGSLRWTQSDSVPLGQISSEMSGSLPSVILRFEAPVDVLSVSANPDDRTLSVAIAAATAPAAAALREGIFVINLGSTPIEAPLDPARATAGTQLYQTRSRIHEVLRYHQRLGFFASEETAREALAQLPGALADAWVSEVTDLERDAVLRGTQRVDLAQIVVRSEQTPSLPPASVERLTELMEDARVAAAGGDLTRAATIYERIAAYPVAPFRQNAGELLGVVREKAGQLALARAAYETYLKQYPDGAAAGRVRQRLNTLLAPNTPMMSARVEADRTHGAESAWDVFGSWYQFYRYDQFQVNQEKMLTTRSLLSSDLDTNARRRSDALDLRLRLTGGYEHDFLDSSESEFRASMAYVDLASRRQTHSARVGRQTRTSGGPLGRFDGAYYGYRLSEHTRVNLVGGAPVATTRDSIDTDRLFYGASIDFGPIAQSWNFNLYGISQSVESLVDRQSVGSELRYFSGNMSLFAVADYDVHFSEPNILYLIGSNTFGEATTLSLIADRRRSPLLSTSNALIGQMTATTIAELRQTYSDDEIKQLALDRSPISTSYTALLSQAIDQRFRISADVSRSTLDAMPASGGVEAFPESGPDTYYNLQLIGTELIANSDLGVFGVRYTDATTYTGVSGLLNYRYRSSADIDINPRLRVDRRNTRSDQTLWVYAPGLRTVWNTRRAWTLELELSAELSDQKFLETTDKTKLYFAYLGYRYDF
ncbi:MAG: tetratricopeptide repeat protein [Sinimarinibacterium sp.]|jgi:hypothetical protein